MTMEHELFRVVKKDIWHLTVPCLTKIICQKWKQNNDFSDIQSKENKSGDEI